MKIKQYIAMGLVFLIFFLIVVYRNKISSLIGFSNEPLRSSDKGGVTSYIKCQTLKSGMTEADVLRIMGEPNEVRYADVGPQKNKKVLVYNNPVAMDDHNRIYIDTVTSLSSPIYCCNLEMK